MSYLLYNYVVAYASDKDHNAVVMLVKDRPEHLKGVLMLPGGKIEEGEDAVQATLRELYEEAGLWATEGEVMGSLSGTRSHIWYVKVTLPDNCWKEAFHPREGETEQPIWLNPEAVLSDPRLMPNLRLIMPMIRMGKKGWHIRDETGEWRTKRQHKLYVTLPDDTLVHEVMVQGMGEEEEE